MMQAKPAIQAVCDEANARVERNQVMRPTFVCTAPKLLNNGVSSSCCQYFGDHLAAVTEIDLAAECLNDAGLAMTMYKVANSTRMVLRAMLHPLFVAKALTARNRNNGRKAVSNRASRLGYCEPAVTLARYQPDDRNHHATPPYCYITGAIDLVVVGSVSTCARALQPSFLLPSHHHFQSGQLGASVLDAVARVCTIVPSVMTCS